MKQSNFDLGSYHVVMAHAVGKPLVRTRTIAGSKEVDVQTLTARHQKRLKTC